MDEEKTTGTQLSVHHGTMVSGFHVPNPFKSWFWWSNRNIFWLNHNFALKPTSLSWFLLVASPFWMWSVQGPIFDIRNNWSNSSFSLCFTFYFLGIADLEPPNNEPYSLNRFPSHNGSPIGNSSKIIDKPKVKDSLWIFKPLHMSSWNLTKSHKTLMNFH